MSLWPPCPSARNFNSIGAAAEDNRLAARPAYPVPVQTSAPRLHRILRFAAAALIVIGAAGCSTEDDDGAIDVRDQDPGCHRAALASAAQQTGFEWNGKGMDRYRSEYDSCMRMAG